MLQNYTYIHYTIQEKLIKMHWNFYFYSICKLFTVEVQQRRKQLQRSVAETTAHFLLSKSFLVCTFSQYSSFPTISCFQHSDAWKNVIKKNVATINLQLYNASTKASVVVLVRSCGAT
jgi:hypothetical protein